MSHCLYWKMMIISISKCILPSSAAEIHPGPNWPYSNEWTDRHSNGIVQWIQSDQLQSTEIPLYLILWTRISACMVSDQNPAFSRPMTFNGAHKVHDTSILKCSWQQYDVSSTLNHNMRSSDIMLLTVYGFLGHKSQWKVAGVVDMWPITLTGEIISRILSTNM